MPTIPALIIPPYNGPDKPKPPDPDKYPVFRQSLPKKPRKYSGGNGRTRLGKIKSCFYYSILITAILYNLFYFLTKFSIYVYHKKTKSNHEAKWIYNNQKNLVRHFDIPWQLKYNSKFWEESITYSRESDRKGLRVHSEFGNVTENLKFDNSHTDQYKVSKFNRKTTFNRNNLPVEHFSNHTTHQPQKYYTGLKFPGSKNFYKFPIKTNNQSVINLINFEISKLNDDFISKDLPYFDRVRVKQFGKNNTITKIDKRRKGKRDKENRSPPKKTSSFILSEKYHSEKILKDLSKINFEHENFKVMNFSFFPFRVTSDVLSKDFEQARLEQEKFLNLKMEIIPNCTTKNDKTPPITVYVKSSTSLGYLKRSIIRQTWGREVDVVFLLLVEPKEDRVEAAKAMLADEILKFGDILLLVGFEDVNWNLSYKTVGGLMHAKYCRMIFNAKGSQKLPIRIESFLDIVKLEKENQKEQSKQVPDLDLDATTLTFDNLRKTSTTTTTTSSNLSDKTTSYNPFTLFTDDDVFWFMENFLKNCLLPLTLDNSRQKVVIGNVLWESTPIRAGTHRATDERIVISNVQYPFKIYPAYPNGMAMLVDPSSFDDLFRQVFRVPIYKVSHLDDVYLGLLAFFHNKMVDDEILESKSKNGNLGKSNSNNKRNALKIKIKSNPGFNTGYNWNSIRGCKLLTSYNYNCGHFNAHLGRKMSKQEINYLVDSYKKKCFDYISMYMFNKMREEYVFEED